MCEGTLWEALGDVPDRRGRASFTAGGAEGVWGRVRQFFLVTKQRGWIL